MTTSFKISQELLKNNLKAAHDKFDKFWIQLNDKSEPEPRSLLTIKDEFSVEKIVASYDLETILNALPKKHPFIVIRGGTWFYELRIWYSDGIAFIGYQNSDGSDKLLVQEQQENESLADTAAKLWIKLKENQII